MTLKRWSEILCLDEPDRVEHFVDEVEVVSYVARMTDRAKHNLAKCKHMRTVHLGERKKKDVN